MRGLKDKLLTASTEWRNVLMPILSTLSLKKCCILNLWCASLSPLLLSTHCTPSFSLRGKSDIWYHFGRYLTLPLNISFAIHWNHSPSPSVTFLHSSCCPLPSPGLLLLICFLCWLISSTPLITSCISSALQLATFSPPPKIPSFSPQVGAQVLLVLPTAY